MDKHWLERQHFFFRQTFSDEYSVYLFNLSNIETGAETTPSRATYIYLYYFPLNINYKIFSVLLFIKIL